MDHDIDYSAQQAANGQGPRGLQAPADLWRLVVGAGTVWDGRKFTFVPQLGDLLASGRFHPNSMLDLPLE